MSSEHHVAPVKPAYTTSTFQIGTFAALLTPLIPILYKAAENYAGTLPPNSWLAATAPGVLAAVYGLLRYLTVNGERQASAHVAAAEAMGAHVMSTPLSQLPDAPQPVSDADELQSGVILSTDDEIQTPSA